MAESFNTIIISDLHLGEDLSPSANAATSRHVDLVERQLVAFFRHYSRRRQDGLAWRVVVNGDMVDFMAITILPNQPELARLVSEYGEDDKEFGLRRTVNATLAKIKMVGERHADLFAAMARFVARGNRIDIVCGNHDIEFHWPEVQAAFRNEVIRAYQGLPEASRPGAPGEGTLESRVGFHPWFFYEAGVAWIEHGHQYDENCAFDYGLNPLHPVRNEILSNVDTASTRYMTSYVQEIDAHAQEDWSAGGYVRFAASLGLRGSLRMTKAYYHFARALLTMRKATIGPRARRLRRRLQRERLEALSDTWSLDASILRDVDGLRRRPAVSSLRRLMQVLMLDKVCIFGAGLLAIAIATVLLGPGWNAALAAMCTVACARGFMWLAARGRNVDPAAPLELVPERLLARIDADYVVFGHTHKPVRKALDGGGTYFNTGTWLPSGKPGLLRAFTHVVIRHGVSGATAELCQWRDGASRPFSPAASEAAVASARAPEGHAARAEAAS